MDLTTALAQLQALTNPTMWKLNEKHGALGRQYGVKLGDIRTLAKAIKVNPALARALWDTGNVDARLLAVLLMKPATLTRAELDGLVRSNEFIAVSDWLNAYVVKAHPDKELLRGPWMDDPAPFARRAGWSLTAERVQKAPEGLNLDQLLDRLEAEMPIAPEVVQWTMNFTLGLIGIHHPAQRTRAVAMAEQMGICRDYPTPKGCTSPFVPLWVAEMVRRAG